MFLYLISNFKSFPQWGLNRQYYLLNTYRVIMENQLPHTELVSKS